MTRSQIIQTSILVAGILGIQGLLELDQYLSSIPKEDAVITQVKHEYAISCTQGMELNDPYITCKDLKRFIDKYEGRYVKTVRSKLVSEVGR